MAEIDQKLCEVSDIEERMSDLERHLVALQYRLADCEKSIFPDELGKAARD